MQTKKRLISLIRTGTGLVILAAILMTGLFSSVAPAAAATLPASTCTIVGSTRTCDLWAKTGSVDLPGAAGTTIWGYTDTAAGAAQLPGPALIVNEGETVVVNLTNDLTVDTAILFQGQDMIPDRTGVAGNGGFKAYTFIANRPGTYLYGAGLLAGGQYQAAMGLYGTLIVRPDPAFAAVSGTSTAADAPAYDSTVLADGPIHYWRFEESSTASAALDQGITGGNDGAYIGGITLSQPSASLNLGSAALFDGASGTFVDTGLFHPGDSVTVEAWVNLDAAANKAYHAAVARWDGSYELDINQGSGNQANFVARNDSNAFGITASAAPMTRDDWHHLSAVFDGATGTLTTYLDGVAGTPAAIGGVLQDAGPTPDRLLIGATRNGSASSYNWTGLIDEVAIYDVVLTPAQIQAHIDASAASLGLTLTDATAAFTADLVGGTVSNTTDGSSCIVDAFTATTLTCAAPLSGGTANAWAIGDGYTATAGAGFAYSDAASAYDDEAVLVLGEIDPALNNSATPAAFDMRNYAPRYFLINGQAYPDTTAIGTMAGNRVLLRYLNAGMQFHSMALLGMHQTVIANDGSPLAHSYRMVGETFGPGQTVDTIATIPAAAVDGSQFAIYDGNLMLHNSNAAGMGGMLTFLTVTGTPPTGDTTGPVTSNVAYAAGTLSATVDDSATGGSTIAAAEYFMDSGGAAGSGTAMIGAFAAQSEVVTAAVSVPPGSHTLYVRGQDSEGNWGVLSSVLVNGGDATGPATTGLTLTPNPSNGSVSVALHATGNDSASGGSNIVAAEYTIDGALPPVAMDVNVAAPIASLDATIAAATVNVLAEGPHVVAVRSQDAAGNWGALATIELSLDKTGPITTDVTAAPNPNNGQLGFNTTTPAVRVTAAFADTTSNINAGEGFIDTVGADGTGFPFAASDGSFNSQSETGFADIPLTTIILLSNGTHTIYVHSKDAAGNWGPTSSVILTIDKIAPAVSAVSAAPNPTVGDPVTLSATATDAATAVTQAEWFTGADPGVGNGTAMTVSGTGPWSLSATIDVSTWINGSYTLNVRARDAAGNWSGLNSTLLVVDAPPPPALLYFSTAGNFAVPGTAGPYDDADIYGWSGGTNYTRLFDATVAGLPGGADIDALLVVDADTFYMSFNGTVNPPGPLGNVDDSDIVLYDAGVWSLYFDGSDVGLSTNNEDVDAIDILTDGSVVISTLGNGNVPGAGGFNDEDLLRCAGTFGPATTCTWSLYFDGSDVGLANNNSEDVDGVSVSAGDIYLSTLGNFGVTGLAGQGVDVFACNAPTTGSNTACASFGMFFDGSVNGITDNLDAIDLP